jgi:mRNA interferase MazF
VDVVIERFAVYLVALDPTIGSEINKKRPCVVISPGEMHQNLRTVIIAPMTTRLKRYPTRVACRFAAKQGEVALDQLRVVDQSRLIKRLGKLDAATAARIATTLVEIFQ